MKKKRLYKTEQLDFYTVQVTYYDDFEGDRKRLYRVRGSYVYDITNKDAYQVCKDMASTGHALESSDENLLKTIRYELKGWKRDYLKYSD